MKTKELIINKAIKCFLQYGIRCVTMDQLASELGKSKKTLYKYFRNKDELVETALNFHENAGEIACEEIDSKEEMDPMEKSFIIFMYNIENLDDFSQAAIFELKKYYADFWDKFYKRKRQVATEYITKNLLEGKELGIYRKDLNIDFAANIYFRIIMLITSGGLGLNEKVKVLYIEYFLYHTHAISSEKGKELIDKYKQKYFNF